MKLDSNDYGFPSWFAAYKEAKKLGNNEVVLQRKFISLFEIAIGNHFVLPPPHQSIAELRITMQDLKILAFDELNAISFPGETLALLETLGIKNVSLMKTPLYLTEKVIWNQH